MERINEVKAILAMRGRLSGWEIKHYEELLEKLLKEENE